MSRYDFKSLSHQDFEELTRDILQAEWEIALEAFKTGRDQGIDLRYARVATKTTIVQCKHYANSTFGKLLSHLRDEELQKVQRLCPNRYVVVTSLGLTPGEKDKIVAALSPFVLTPSDVLGADDLNGLLSRHSSVESANFKLWLTNTEVIARIIHNAEVCQTQFEVNRIRKKLPVFVQSRTYPRARQLLDEQRVIIISGEPGIGKTTLAEMLLFSHLDDGYEPVVMQNDVSEGKRLLRQGHKQIFYYDDFLGQTFLGDQRSYVGHNHDASLLQFMEIVRSTPHSRFILTTREHILRQAMQASERFQHSSTQTYKCVLELKDYSFGQRAKILYNHIYFSDLSRLYKEAILLDDFFLEIIKHKHFNPRLIEWLTTLTRLSTPPPEPEKYCKSITALLQSPEHIWSHAFESQISHAARELLLTLYSLGDHIDIEELEFAFDGVHQGSCVRYNRSSAVGDFRAALQELDGGFLNYSSCRARFLNPSIRDFTSGVLLKTPKLAIELIVDAKRFTQLCNIWKLSTKDGGNALCIELKAHAETFRINAMRLMTSETMQWIKTPEGSKCHVVDTIEELRLEEMIRWSEAIKDQTFVDLLRMYAETLATRWKSHAVMFRLAIEALDTMAESDWLMGHGGDEIYRIVLDCLLSHVNEARARDWERLLELPETSIYWTESDDHLLSAGIAYYRQAGVDHERDECIDVSDLNELKDFLQQLDDKYVMGFWQTIKTIEKEIDERDERQPCDGDDGGGFSHQSETQFIDPFNDDDVREMFETLRS